MVLEAADLVGCLCVCWFILPPSRECAVAVVPPSRPCGVLLSAAAPLRVATGLSDARAFVRAAMCHSGVSRFLCSHVSSSDVRELVATVGYREPVFTPRCMRAGPLVGAGGSPGAKATILSAGECGGWRVGLCSCAAPVEVFSQRVWSLWRSHDFRPTSGLAWFR